MRVYWGMFSISAHQHELGINGGIVVVGLFHGDIIIGDPSPLSRPEESKRPWVEVVALLSRPVKLSSEESDMIMAVFACKTMALGVLYIIGMCSLIFVG